MSSLRSMYVPSIRTLLAVGVVTAGLAAIGCDAITEGHQHDEGAGAAAQSEVIISGSSAIFAFDERDGWRISPGLEVAEGATRVGFMIDLWEDRDDTSKMVIEARGYDAAGEPTPWQQAELTWVEHPFMVGLVELDAMVYRTELRMSDHTLSSIAYLTWSAVIPLDGAESGDDATDGGLETTQLALSSMLANAGVRSRSTWDAKASNGCGTDSGKYRMAVHHTYTPTTSYGSYEARLRSIQSYHQDTKGWCDVGYHLLVTADGTVWEGRPMNYRGAHVGGQNTGNIGVSFVGCFESGSCEGVGGVTQPTQSMLSGAAGVIASLGSHYGIGLTASNVKGHGQHAGQSTSCPGNQLIPHIPELLSGNVSAPAVQPPAGADPEPQPQPPAFSAKGRVLGVVWDASVTESPTGWGNVRVTNATVETGGDGGATGVTAGDALWYFELTPGTYSVHASAPGYDANSRTVSVEANTDTWASVGLFPAQAPPVPEPAPPAEDPAPPADNPPPPVIGGGAKTFSVFVFEKYNPGLTPIPGAIVHVPGHGAVAVGSTGLATFQSDAASVMVRAYHNQFDPLAMTVTLTAGQVNQVNMPLAPSTGVGWGNGDVMGVVWDGSITSSPSAAGNVRLGDAIVTCSCGRAQKVRADDAFWEFSVPAGEWIITAIAPGHVEQERVVYSAGWGTTWGSIGLLQD